MRALSSTACSSIGSATSVLPVSVRAEPRSAARRGVHTSIAHCWATPSPRSRTSIARSSSPLRTQSSPTLQYATTRLNGWATASAVCTASTPSRAASSTRRILERRRQLVGLAQAGEDPLVLAQRQQRGPQLDEQIDRVAAALERGGQARQHAEGLLEVGGGLAMGTAAQRPGARLAQKRE